MDPRHAERLQRARISLEGLSVGDAFGVLHGNRRQPLVSPTWKYTDDTLMALSIYHILRDYGEIDQDALAASFAQRYVQSKGRGYGPGMRSLLPAIDRSGDWRELARNLFGGLGSYGNGSAMRVAPLGAYFADDMDALVENARRSAEVTHAHPEAAAGAIAVAGAAAVAWNARGSEPPSRSDFINEVLMVMPRRRDLGYPVLRARDLHPSMPLKEVIEILGNGSQVTCQDTVPFVLWCAGEALINYEEALWLTASAGGDRDTTCAMVGGIVACYTGIESIPDTWRARREPLPAWAIGEA